MAKTKLHGNRISEGAIETRHLAKGFKLSEEFIEFNMQPHEHKNKSVLDIIVNSIPQTLQKIDLKDVLYTILEVTDARDVNKTLRQTLEGKASAEELDTLIAEINEARRGYATLNDFFTEFQREVENILAQHIGAIGHKDLDSMYAEVRAARGIHQSLKDRLDELAMNTGGGAGGTINITMLTPWSFDYVLEPGKTLIDLSNSYEPGNSTLQVFDGPVLLQAGVDYNEVSPTQIEMLDVFTEPLPLRFIGVGSGRLFEWERRISGNGSIKRIELADSYRPGMRELQVYEDGLLLRENEDYVEVAPHVIEFNEVIPVGSLVTIYKRRN